MTNSELARLIDHTLLKPEAKAEDLKRLCQEALEWGFYSVCVNPYWVSFCARELRGSKVKVCSVVGFPLGASLASTKAIEARHALEQGAEEIDMVINLGALKSGQWHDVENDISTVARACHRHCLKVILETHFLTIEEKIRACTVATEAKAQFVKTSTGFSGGGATVEDVALMRTHISKEMAVKASGGIRDRAGLMALVAAGATRIGTSSAVKILSDQNSNQGSY